ncbi:hypothetical protein IFR05_003987 [Cadophora sp. M221]|nr:hypothetical protein IFR05_003987 [Cadophora sp. M221]
MSPPITITRATPPRDYTLISALENRVFYHDPFSIVAFGPERDSPANIEARAQSFARQASPEGGSAVFVKAVLGERGVMGGDGETIVGAAQWNFVVGRERDGVVDAGAGAEEDKKREDRKDEERKEVIEADEGAEKKNVWGIGANIKFCEDVFLVADEHMIRSTEGRDYAKLSTLIVAPENQRQGIGSRLLETGLKEVDRLGLQCVLASSKEGLGLYKRFGFVEFETMKLKLWEYEGGEGFEGDDHVVMWRPCMGKEGGMAHE